MAFLASWGDSVANDIIDFYIKGTAKTEPAGCFLHLYTVPPDPDGTGGTPVGGTWYTPVNVRSALGAVASRQVTNTSSIACGTPDGAYGPLQYAAARVSTSPSSTLILPFQLSVFITTVSGQPLSIPAGTLIFRQP